MGKITGFLEIDRHDRKYAPATDRVQHYREFVIPLSEKDTRDQAARCMNCGIPYCHGTGSVQPGTPGCPVNNQIPDFNDLVYQGNWEEASRNLTRPTTFPSSPAASVRRRAKPPARSTSTTIPSPSRPSNAP